MPDAAPTVDLPPSRREAQPLVAVIEDDPAARAALALVLADWGYTTVQAACSRSVLDLSSAPRLAALICDFHLGDRETGVEAVLAIRAALGRCVPAIIMSGSFGRSARDAAVPHGLVVLTKPFVPAHLEQLLRQELAPGGR